MFGFLYRGTIPIAIFENIKKELKRGSSKKRQAETSDISFRGSYGVRHMFVLTIYLSILSTFGLVCLRIEQRSVLAASLQLLVFLE